MPIPHLEKLESVLSECLSNFNDCVDTANFKYFYYTEPEIYRTLLTSLLKKHGFEKICFVGGSRIRENVKLIKKQLLSDPDINPTKEKDISALSRKIGFGIGIFESIQSIRSNIEIGSDVYVLLEIRKAVFRKEKTLFVFNKHGYDYSRVIGMVDSQKMRHSHKFLLLDYCHEENA